MLKTEKIITKEYGIIGNPLSHSYSPTFFNEKFVQKGIKSAYHAFDIASIEGFLPIVEQRPLMRGFNVTIPYKQEVMPYLHQIDSNAQAIGAVNVVKVETKDGKPYLTGYNTDWYGFTRSIQPLLKPWHTKALVLGTGGASKAITYALTQLGITYKLASRTPKDGQFSYQDITPAIMEEYTIIINTTPVGMFPNIKECPNIPYQYITNKHLAFDLTYNPIRTLFLQQAEMKGATIRNGWEMFVYQALRSYQIWEGVEWTHRF
ncbi:MAG: shikimate dehydrogenase [Paludibacteraceae bacterium]|nr:shikimate dehydrogenase [Paludibacteraceae bacterium]